MCSCISISGGADGENQLWPVISGKRNQERGKFEILMAVTMQNTVFWDMKLWSMFQRNLLLPSSELKNGVIRRFLQNGNKFLLDHMASNPGRQYSSNHQCYFRYCFRQRLGWTKLETFHLGTVQAIHSLSVCVRAKNQDNCRSLKSWWTLSVMHCEHSLSIQDACAGIFVVSGMKDCKELT